MNTTAERRPHLLVVNQYLDTVEASGRVLRQLVDGLAEDFDVTVVAGPHDARYAPAAGHPAVRVLRVPSPRLARTSLLQRAVNYVAFLVGAAMRALVARRPDVILTMTDPPPVGLVGRAVAFVRQAPRVIVLQDLHPDVGLVTGRLTNPVVVRVLGVIQRAVLRRADLVVVIGRRMAEIVAARGVPERRLRVIPNWSDTSGITPRPRLNAWSARQGLDDRFVVMHSGNIGQLQMLETLVNAAVLLPDVEVVVVGDGSGRPALEERLARAPVANVRLVEHQPPENLAETLASADVHVVSLTPGLAGLVEPSKIYGILAAGRPVVAAVDRESEAARLVEDAGIGAVVPPGDAAALAAAIEALRATGEDHLAGLGRRARARAEGECSRQHAIRTYRDTLLEVTAR